MVSIQSVGGFRQSEDVLAVHWKFLSSLRQRNVQPLYILWSVATRKIPPFFSMRAISLRLSGLINRREAWRFFGHGSGKSKNILLNKPSGICENKIRTSSLQILKLSQREGRSFISSGISEFSLIPVISVSKLATPFLNTSAPINPV